MRDLFREADAAFDGGFDSTFWKTNLFLLAADTELTGKRNPGYAIWEHTDFWKAKVPIWFPSGEAVRFMRLLQALEVPRPVPFPLHM
jgi:hypothetical protein